MKSITSALFAATAVISLLCPCAPAGQSNDIPAVHSGIHRNIDGALFYLTPDGDTLLASGSKAEYSLDQMRNSLHGTEDGIGFDFGDSGFTGRIYYGFMNSADGVRHSYPVYFKRSAEITGGKASVDIRNQMSGLYDFIGWEKSGIVRLGYRIVNARGEILYDGKILLRGTGPFEIDTSIVEGPFVNLVKHSGAVVSFETNFPARCRIMVDDRSFADSMPVTHHEIELAGLEPDTEHSYAVIYGNHVDRYSFRTAPASGTRLPFTFAYASDGRANSGGGERDIRGVNAYMLKRIAVLCAARNARLLQFTGDLIDGYSTDEGEMQLEYANWKRTVEPFACYFPFIAGMGNHEAFLHYFTNGKKGVAVDRFPFATESAEEMFARNFVNPTNGPVSEDGAVYDPDPQTTDFPSYKENVFHYTYDNIGVICLNSNYWYSPGIKRTPEIGGNLHGYLMDNQLEWLESTIEMFEADGDIDHVFVTVHTPILPNGGHVSDDMWYDGDNSPRPWVAGKPVERGIIERRDQLLDLLMNASSKVVAVLTGDEHNYNRLKLTEGVSIYPDDYKAARLTRFRPIWLINNGAAGAPYYGQEETPWMTHVEVFSTQNAVVFFHVSGKSITVEVINPDTMELIDRFDM